MAATPRGGFSGGGAGTGQAAGDLRLIGAANALAGTVRYTPGSGYTGNSLLPADQVRPGDYLIVEVGGTWPPVGPIGNQPFDQGDWIISDGAFWNRLHLGGAPVIARNVTLSPAVHGADNVQDGLENTVNRNGDTMEGDLFLFGSPLLPLQAVTKQYVDDAIDAIPLPPPPDLEELLPRDGSRPMEGDLILAGLPTLDEHATSKEYVDQEIAAIPPIDLDPLLARDGSRPMEGDLILAFLPTQASHATSKIYVDDLVAGVPPLPDLDPLLPRDGSRAMLGDLVLFRDPQLPEHAVTRAYVDQLVSSASILIGAIDATTGDCLFIDGSTGPLPPANRAGEYVICVEPGTIPSGPASGITLVRGDWLYDSGSVWFRIAIGSTGAATTAAEVALVPSVLGIDNVQAGIEAIAGILPTQWLTGVNYAVGALVVWDNLIFRVAVAIPAAPAIPDFNTIAVLNGSQSDYWMGPRDNTNGLWVANNWVLIANLPSYGSYKIVFDCFGTSIDSSFTFEVSTTFGAATFSILSQTKNPSGTMWRQFRLSAQGGGANLVRFEGQLGTVATNTEFKIIIVGLRVDRTPVQRVSIPKPLVASAANQGGTQYLLMAAYGNGAVQAPRFDVFETGGRFHCHHPEASDANDGDIGARIFGRGLNIVGVRTEANDPVGNAGRSVQVYGELFINGNYPVTAREFRCRDDNFGIQFFSGAWLYKRSGGGMTLRLSSGNQQLQIEDNDGSAASRRNIIDQRGGAFTGGISFGSQAQPTPTDVSRHLALWGTTYGLSITSGHLNYNIAAGAANAHSFYLGGNERFRVAETVAYARGTMLVIERANSSNVWNNKQLQVKHSDPENAVTTIAGEAGVAFYNFNTPANGDLRKACIVLQRTTGNPVRERKFRFIDGDSGALCAIAASNFDTAFLANSPLAKYAEDGAPEVDLVKVIEQLVIKVASLEKQVTELKRRITKEKNLFARMLDRLKESATEETPNER
jgi:hypothetical protein